MSRLVKTKEQHRRLADLASGSLPSSAPGGSAEVWNNNGVLNVTPTHVAPVNSVAPAITGTAQEGSTLTVSNGTWTGVPTPTYSRQWFGDGSPIAGATATTLALTAEHVGMVITARVTAANARGSASALSNATSAVIAAG